MKTVLIAGITGQDGSYLAELLLQKGYEVHGLVRRTTTRRSNIDHLREKLHLHFGDLCDASSLARIIEETKPVEFYNLAAQSQVRLSFDNPVYTSDVIALGSVRVLETLRKTCPGCRYYQASTGEMFGASPPPQSETSPPRPQSPYAVAMLYAYHCVRIYREGYGLYACAGILFNHESPRRGEEFVTRKITRGVADIVAGRKDTLELGNLDARRDWGYAKEYVEAMWRMLQRDAPEDYVIATGETHSVRDFVEVAFSRAGLDYRDHVRHHEHLERPNEVHALCGDARKARRELDWHACTTFEQLVELMLDHDMKRVPSSDGLIPT